MISGYVIYKSALGRSPFQFAIARFWRLYPAYWVAICLTTALVVYADAFQFSVPLRDFFWNFTMFQDRVGAKSVDGAYWSLFVEMTFYILVGIAIGLKVIHHTYQIVSLWLMISAINLFVRSYWIDTLLVASWGPFFCIGIISYKLRQVNVEGSLDAKLGS